MRLAALTMFLALCPIGHAKAVGTWGMPSKVCTITDPRAGEISGIAVSRLNPGVFYVHNDSGDAARFFAVDKAGNVRATVRVTNAEATDWEDMAAGSSPDGRSMLYFADTGDNMKARPEVVIYAVPEPKIAKRGGAKTLEVTAKALRFTYPDGPHDCETLMVDPRGRALYVVTKEASGTPSGIFRLEARWDGTRQTAVKVGGVRFTDPVPLYPNLSTGGDISPDGTRIVVRTYQQAYEWRIPKGKRPEYAFKAAPTAWPLAMEAQGEAICYGSNSRTWLTTSENTPAPVQMYTWTEKQGKANG